MHTHKYTPSICSIYAYTYMFVCVLVKLILLTNVYEFHFKYITYKMQQIRW